MIELSPRIGRLIARLLSVAPQWSRRLIWPEYGRIGLDPQGAEMICIRWNGARLPVAYSER